MNTEIQNLFIKIDRSLSLIEVKGDSVKHLYDARLDLQRLLTELDAFLQKETVEENKQEV